MVKLHRLAGIAIVLICTGALIACGSSGTPAGSAEKHAAPAKPQPKEATLYTAQEAFTRLTGYARKWAADARPIHVESEVNAESNGQGGKSSVWRGLFASPSRQTVKTFICSGSQDPNGPPLGVSSPAGEYPLTAEMNALQFEPFFVKTDTDKAFAVAQEHGGAALTKKDPSQPVAYLLEWDRKLHAPVWYVIYGTSLKERQGLGTINASTGAFLRAGK
jgi:hypothetical protein